jgi:K+-transporting ATPase ATPase A chain
MVGRTPEFLGKKIEARSQNCCFHCHSSPLLILSGTALASYFAANDTAMGYWFNGNATGW